MGMTYNQLQKQTTSAGQSAKKAKERHEHLTEVTGLKGQIVQHLQKIEKLQQELAIAHLERVKSSQDAAMMQRVLKLASYWKDSDGRDLVKHNVQRTLHDLGMDRSSGSRDRGCCARDYEPWQPSFREDSFFGETAWAKRVRQVCTDLGIESYIPKPGDRTKDEEE